MKLNVRNIERILDVLQYAVQHYGQTFMEDDIYKACPAATSNIIDLLDEREVITCTQDGISFDESNVEDYRSFLSDLQDELEELDIPKKEKRELLDRLNLSININVASIDVNI